MNDDTINWNLGIEEEKKDQGMMHSVWDLLCLRFMCGSLKIVSLGNLIGKNFWKYGSSIQATYHDWDIDLGAI